MILQNSEVVAVDHHNATIIHNPGTDSESIEKFHADLTKARILHKTKQSPTFSDQNPTDSSGYFNSIIKSMLKSQRIVILSHGTSSSSAAEKLFTVIQEKYPTITQKIIAIKKCDLEAMTEPEIIALGIELLHGSEDKIT